MRKPQQDEEQRPSFREQYRVHVRQMLLDLAHGMLADEGEAALTMTRLAEEAGLSIGSVYRYFVSRDDLLATLWHERIEKITARLDPRPDDLPAEPTAALHACIDAWTINGSDDPAALVKLAEDLERAVDSAEPCPATRQGVSLADPVVDVLLRASGPKMDRQSAMWRAAILLRVIAATSTPPPTEEADPTFARRTVTALLDSWMQPR